MKVTLGAIYDKLLDVEKKVDPIPAMVMDHEKRLRDLEVAMHVNKGRESQNDSTQARKPPWTAIAALAVSAIVAVRNFFQTP